MSEEEVEVEENKERKVNTVIIAVRKNEESGEKKVFFYNYSKNNITDGYFVMRRETLEGGRIDINMKLSSSELLSLLALILKIAVRKLRVLK